MAASASRFADMNNWLGNQQAFVNLNGQLTQPLVPITALNAASIYLKGGLAVEHMKSALAGVSQ